MRKNPAVKRIAVLDLPEIISDLDYWCGADGKELIVEQLQDEPEFWNSDLTPSEEEIDVRRKSIQEKSSRLQTLKAKSATNPVFVYPFELKDLFKGLSPWTGNEFEKFIIYSDFLYGAQGPYTDEEFKLLCLQEFDKEREFFENLKSKFSEPQDPATCEKNERRSIPEKVRIYVWRRDGGKCAKCGSRENLEYDHIIPVSRGGSNTARNIELLCEVHNREKGDAIC